MSENESITAKMSSDTKAALESEGWYQLPSPEIHQTDRWVVAPYMNSSTVELDKQQAWLEKCRNAFGNSGAVFKKLRQAMFNDTGVITLPKEDFLRKEAIVVEVIRKSAADMIFMPWARRFRMPENSGTEVKWLRDLHSDVDDPLRTDPEQMDEGDEFERVRATDMVRRDARLHRRGFALEFTRRTMLDTTDMFDYVNFHVNRATDWFTRTINEDIGRALTNNFDTAQSGDDAVRVEAADLVWSDSDADPIKDIRDLILKMETEDDYFVTPTDLFIPPENYRELLDFVDFAQQDWALDPFTERRTLQIDGVRVHKAPPNSGLPASTGIMLSDPTNRQPVVLYEKMDPKFDTVTDMLQIHEFDENKNHNTVFQIFKWYLPVLPDPKQVGLLHSL